MKTGHASRTAKYMAFFRALETEAPLSRRLFEDRYASYFLSPALLRICFLAKVPLANKILQKFIDFRWPGALTSGIARTQFIDHVVGAELNTGVKQIIILGAGFDARAYRMKTASNILFFEVDHPSTSAAKQNLVKQIPRINLEYVRFVPVDFDSESLPGKMNQAGYDENLRTLFIWEGVTNYLTESAVDLTLNWCKQAAAGSKLVFTYVHKRVLDTPEEFYGTRKIIATLRNAGEQWTFGLDPSSLAEFLSERGLTLDVDLDANDYRQICYGRAASHMRGYEFYRLAICSIRE